MNLIHRPFLMTAIATIVSLHNPPGDGETQSIACWPTVGRTGLGGQILAVSASAVKTLGHEIGSCFILVPPTE